MRPNEIKWGECLPIPWGRTKRFLLLTSGLLVFLLITTLVSTLGPHSENLAAMTIAFFFGAGIAASVQAAVAGAISRKSSTEWYEIYYARNVIGYDVVFWTEDGVSLVCEVVPSNDRQFGRRGVRFPLIPGRRGWIYGPNLKDWRVTWDELPTAEKPPALNSNVWVYDKDGERLLMSLSTLVEQSTRYFERVDVGTIGALAARLFIDEYSLREKVTKLELRLSAAHDAMHYAMMSVATSSRLGNSKAGRAVRMNLAATLHDLSDPLDPKVREFYGELMKPERPRLPRRRTT